ncbi:IscS subfamily cysteine desulfurase [Pontibacillus sp. ALD_SL1]|uniref:IscS subfamily cysteine desulfurase n=1 Tax=Pontibacillus sp. ALD_SL1 TaxID=2777185 RepID=UPI001A96CD7D|nr:IscS subfamily cysteine desulfurase [Pontibacillus sp. ALD_SL1]QSS99966.1 IscS subfamily cysteine desulfurase [Pontibacillus sp. ALD_SL1]
MKRYFDYAASCPIDEEALETYMRASKEYFANSTSLHDEGTKASRLLEHCRETLAHLIGGEAKGLYFTSGGSEGNFLAFQALLSAHPGKHIILSEGEHSSVRNTAMKYEAEGYRVTKLPLKGSGIVDLEILKSLITTDTALVSVHHVNSEIGTIQPIREISRICQGAGAFLHSDCVQSFGKIDVQQVTRYVDSLTISSHKVFGPKGVGGLYLSTANTYRPFLPNGVHESGMRAGTLNVPGIAAFAVAAEKSVKNLSEKQLRIEEWKRLFMEELSSVSDRLDFVRPSVGVPIIGMMIHHVEGQWLMLEGNRNGFHFSTGSACQIGAQEPSLTLLSMGKTEEEAKTFIRISFGRDHTTEDVRALAGWLRSVIEERTAAVVQ